MIQATHFNICSVLPIHFPNKEVIGFPPKYQKTGKEGKAGSAKAKQYNIQPYLEADTGAFAADPVIAKMSDAELKRSIDNTKSLMKEAAAKLDFMQAAQYRDEMLRLQDILDGRGKNE